MKNRYINKLIIGIACIFAISSCSDFLDENPKSALIPGQVYSELSILESTVDGLYTSFRSSKAGRTGFTFTLLGLDESKQGIVQMMGAEQAALDNYDGMLNASSAQISEMWAKRWAMVNVASYSIFGLDSLARTEIQKAELSNSELDEATMKKISLLRANSSFVRALCMFEMSMYWGEIPMYEIEDMESTEIDLSKRTLPQVWKQIHDDFEYASKYLAEGKQTGNRATQGAAIAMLGKLHMYAPAESGYRDFDKAIEYFEEIKGRYNLERNYATLFDEFGKVQFNSAESIFEIDYICNSTAPNYWQWDMGSRTLATLGESCYIGGYDVVLPTEYAYQMKTDGGVWEPGDGRRDISIRFDFTYRGQEFETPSWGADELDPHVKKWEDRRIDKYSTPAQAADATTSRSIYYSGKNYIMLRHADILLCYAECLNEVDRQPEAITVVNDVRKRAWGGTLPADKAWTAMDKEVFRKEIMDERMRELCFEGWRRMDLIRTGMFVDLIKERNKWAKATGTISDFHVRWPIPNIELKNNPYMDVIKDQNPGY